MYEMNDVRRSCYVGESELQRANYFLTAIRIAEMAPTFVLDYRFKTELSDLILEYEAKRKPKP